MIAAFPWLTYFSICVPIFWKKFIKNVDLFHRHFLQFFCVSWKFFYFWKVSPTFLRNSYRSAWSVYLVKVVAFLLIQQSDFEKFYLLCYTLKLCWKLFDKIILENWLHIQSLWNAPQPKLLLNIFSHSCNTHNQFCIKISMPSKQGHIFVFQCVTVIPSLVLLASLVIRISYCCLKRWSPEFLKTGQFTPTNISFCSSVLAHSFSVL